jgi:uncharacterized protein YcfJ
MKNALIVAVFATFASSSVLMADHYGYVTNVVPNYYTQSVEENIPYCYDRQITTNHAPSEADVIAGAIIGGVIGNQFGNGSGKDVMTALGAILGADVASKTHRPKTTIQTVCHDNYVVSYRQVLDGYTVTYSYHGINYIFHTYDIVYVGDRVIVRH